ncbi:aminotransferase class III-fold pyridoxal phosphate-dependent enzyme [Candidatus Bipolaricaulota bacterium]|nr:aminotransferase class III-fold pyridoxal phosphate-dependent enzyme [Candidatus Bipolaricaulota bacterium]
MVERRFSRIQTELPGPRSAEVFARKSKYVAAPLEVYAPFIIDHSEGALIEDLDGNRFIDFSGGWGCLNVGQRNARVVSALHDQVDHYLHTDFTAVPYAPFIDLAEELCLRTPLDGPRKAALFNSGAESVENAVKIARAYTGRKSVLVFENAFHGRTLLTMTMTHKAKPYKYGFGPFASDVYRLPYPYTYRKDLSPAEIEQSLLSLVDPSEVAVMVVEPIIGEGGFLVPPAWFLPEMRRLADKYGFVLAFDEVQSGIGRTGKFFAFEHFGAKPDLVCVAKSLGSGLPLSAVIGRAEVMDAPIASAIGGTYAGNPLACRAAIEVIHAIEEERLMERAEPIGNTIKDRFRKLADRYEIVGDIRGIGAMVGMELVVDRETKAPAKEVTGQIATMALRNGAIFPTAGLLGNVLRVLVSLAISNEQLSEGLDILEDAFAEVLG